MLLSVQILFVLSCDPAPSLGQLANNSLPRQRRMKIREDSRLRKNMKYGHARNDHLIATATPQIRMIATAPDRFDYNSRARSWFQKQGPQSP